MKQQGIVLALIVLMFVVVITQSHPNSVEPLELYHSNGKPPHALPERSQQPNELGSETRPSQQYRDYHSSPNHSGMHPPLPEHSHHLPRPPRPNHSHPRPPRQDLIVRTHPRLGIGLENRNRRPPKPNPEHPGPKPKPPHPTHPTHPTPGPQPETSTVEDSLIDTQNITKNLFPESPSKYKSQFVTILFEVIGVVLALIVLTAATLFIGSGIAIVVLKMKGYTLSLKKQQHQLHLLRVEEENVNPQIIDQTPIGTFSTNPQIIEENKI